MAAAEELQYVPHAAARSLAQGRTGNLGVVVPDIANSWSATITKAVQQEARRDGFALFVAGSGEGAAGEGLWGRARGPRGDGLLLVSPHMPGTALHTTPHPIPPFVYNRALHDIPPP